MKKLLISAIGLVAFGTAAAQEVGRVISAVPMIQQVAVPRQDCSVQQVVQPSSSGGGALVGAIVGGLLGHTIGHGMGRAAATGVGVVAGAAIGDRVEAQGQPQAMQYCSTHTSYENRTVGYNVTYEYAGRQYTVQMPYDPGPTIQLQITPVGTPMRPATQGQPLVTAPPVVQGDIVAPVVVTQPVHTVVYPSYAYAYRPAYHWYPPVSFHFGYVHHHRHGHHHWRGHGHHRHWR